MYYPWVRVSVPSPMLEPHSAAGAVTPKGVEERPVCNCEDEVLYFLSCLASGVCSRKMLTTTFV